MLFDPNRLTEPFKNGRLENVVTIENEAKYTENTKKWLNRVNIAPNETFMRMGVDIWGAWKWFDSRLIYESWYFV